TDAGERGGTLVAIPIAGPPGATALTSPGPGFELTAVSPTGERAVFASRGSARRKLAILAFPEETGSFQIRDLAPAPGPARAVAVAPSPDGLLLAVAVESGEVLLLSIPGGDVVARGPGGAVSKRATPLVWSDDGQRLLAGAGPIAVLEARRTELGAAEKAA